MSFQSWITATAKALLRPSPISTPPRPRHPITSLVPSRPLDAESPPTPTHPDLSLVMKHWHLHQKNSPGESWPQFIRALEFRHAFFAQERRECAAKLAQLSARPRFQP
jgi:hypothetical protein